MWCKELLIQFWPAPDSSKNISSITISSEPVLNQNWFPSQLYASSKFHLSMPACVFNSQSQEAPANYAQSLLSLMSKQLSLFTILMRGRSWTILITKWEKNSIRLNDRNSNQMNLFPSLQVYCQNAPTSLSVSGSPWWTVRLLVFLGSAYQPLPVLFDIMSNRSEGEILF